MKWIDTFLNIGYGDIKLAVISLYKYPMFSSSGNLVVIRLENSYPGASSGPIVLKEKWPQPVTRCAVMFLSHIPTTRLSTSSL